MVKISEAFPSEFVKAGQDVEDGDTLKLIDSGSLEESANYGKMQLIFKVATPSGEEKKLAMNGASRSALATEWGDDTSAWKGKVVLVNVAKQSVAGKMRQVIYLEPAPKEAPAKETTK